MPRCVMCVVLFDNNKTLRLWSFIKLPVYFVAAGLELDIRSQVKSIKREYVHAPLYYHAT